jgi:hypothetical protein
MRKFWLYFWGVLFNGFFAWSAYKMLTGGWDSSNMAYLKAMLCLIVFNQIKAQK